MLFRSQTKQSAVSEIERIGGNPTIRTLLGFSRAVGMRLRLTAEPAPLAPASESISHASRTGDDLDRLLTEAQQLTGITEKSALVNTALTCLIERESAQRLARLGGSRPEVVNVPRRRQSHTG